MTASLLLFYVYSLAAIAGGIGLIVSKRLVHAVMWLFVSMIAIAALFLTMGAQFLAALQLFVYGGAITILALFVLMLARPSAEKVEQPAMFGRIAGIGATVALLATIVVAVFTSALPSTLAESPLTSTLAESLFTRYMLPFELAGLLLTVALVGSIVIARGGVGRLPAEKPGAASATPAEPPSSTELVELGEPAPAKAGELL